MTCPVDECYAEVDRLDKHLQTKKHNLRTTDADYHRYMTMGRKSVLSIASNEENEHVENDREMMVTAGSSKTKSTQRIDDDDEDDYVPSNNNDETSSDDEDEDDTSFSKG